MTAKAFALFPAVSVVLLCSGLVVQRVAAVKARWYKMFGGADSLL